MKYYKKLLLLIYLVIAFSYQTKEDFSQSFIRVANSGNPAVVSILSEKKINSNYHQFFDPFGGQLPDELFKGQSLGSGVIIDSDKGYIVTNNHVIDGADEVKVLLFDNREFKAEIIATDPPSDLAVLKVDSKNLSTVELGDSDMLSAGQWVVAIGSPFGIHLNHTVTAGIISAVGRNSVMSRNNFEDFIQHDAAINPGNSGGALFNLNGQLIGINTAIATDGYSRANAGVGFAIPINMVKRVLEDLIADGKVTRGWLGVSIQDVDDSMAKALGLVNKDGAIISQVIQDSPAEEAGCEVQDVVIKVNDERINDSSKLKNVISSGRPKDKTKLTIIRKGIEKNILVTLGTRPDEDDLLQVNNLNNKNFDILGLIVENYEAPINAFKMESKGVKIIEINSDLSNSDINLIRGDIIVEIGNININNINDYSNELNQYSRGDAIMLRVVRNGNPIYVAFEIE